MRIDIWRPGKKEALAQGPTDDAIRTLNHPKEIKGCSPAGSPAGTWPFCPPS
jgi:hypothetical protein